MHVAKEAIRASIRRAFADVALPARLEDMRLARHTGDDSYLSPDEHAAVAEVLGYLAAKWHAEDAADVLREW